MSTLNPIPALKLCLLSLILLLSSVSFAEDVPQLAPFTSDGCSAFPDGTFKHNRLWLKCCTAHDYAYWQGGTYQQRLEADFELKACVQQVGEPSIAALILAGVRVGGSPYWPTRFRWGYGWPFPRGYAALTDQERALVTAIKPIE